MRKLHLCEKKLILGSAELFMTTHESLNNSLGWYVVSCVLYLLLNGDLFSNSWLGFYFIHYCVLFFIQPDLVQNPLLAPFRCQRHTAQFSKMVNLRHFEIKLDFYILFLSLIFYNNITRGGLYFFFRT